MQFLFLALGVDGAPKTTASAAPVTKIMHPESLDRDSAPDGWPDGPLPAMGVIDALFKEHQTSMRIGSWIG